MTGQPLRGVASHKVKDVLQEQVGETTFRSRVGWSSIRGLRGIGKILIRRAVA